MERSLISAVLVVSALLTASFLLVREGSALTSAAGAGLALAGVVGLLLVGRAVALDTREGSRR